MAKNSCKMVRCCDNLGLYLNCTTFKDNLDFKSGISVEFWFSDVLLQVTVRSKVGNRGFRSYEIKLEILLHQRVNFGVDGQLCSIICLQNDLTWHDLGPLGI